MMSAKRMAVIARRATIASGVIIALGLPFRAAGQSSAEVNSGGLQFNLLNPGARSLGMGGAFAAVADDATASYANPAGLVNVSQREVSIEGRWWNYSNFYTRGGHAFGKPTDRGADTQSGLQEGHSRDQVFGASFLSLVYPKARWAVAVYRHELGNFRSTAQSEGPFFDDRGATNRFFPTASTLNLRIDSTGAAFARKFFGDRASVGVSVARYQFDFTSVTNRYFYDGIDPSSFFGPPRYDPSNIQSTQAQQGRGSALTWNAGALWTLHPHKLDIRIGAVYKRGADFGVDVRSVPGPKGAGDDVGLAGRFHVPTSYGVGIAFRPNDGNLVSIDCNRVMYSSLTRDFVTFVPTVDDPNLYRTANGTEFHAGLEHVLYPRKGDDAIHDYVIQGRVGTWRDPDHQIHYADPTSPQSILFRGGTSDWHVAAGVGITMLQGRYVLNMAFDHSRRQQVGSISMVVRWGGPK